MTVCMLLFAVLLSGMLTGCGGNRIDKIFTSDNEIYTYQKIDSERTQIVVSRTGNIEVKSFCEEFEARNPDVQVIYLDITGGTSGCMPLVNWITNGYAPDIVFSASKFFEDEITKQYFENLSANPVIQNYEMAALQRTSTDSDIYWLPGPSNISAIMYNKTLFEQYGWTVPKTFDEFVGLCDRITADTDGEIEAWNPNAKYDAELQTALEAMTYAELFGGLENRSWYNDFIEGKATFTGHMEPYTEAVQTLVDHNILREEHFAYSATARGKEFLAGKIAMVNMNIYDADNDEFDFGYMPFPSTDGDVGYICDSYSCLVGVPVKEHTKKQSDAINRFIEFFSSPEGQRVYIGTALMVSNVKNVKFNQSDDLAALQPAIDAGHMFAMLRFDSAFGYRRNVSLYQIAIDIASGRMTAEECIAAADVEPYTPVEEVASEQPEVVATATQDMTVLETSFYIADAYRETADADIGLIANNAAYRGNLMRIFKGDITPVFVSVLKPRSFANDSTLLKVSMTGRQLTAALNNPLGYEKTDDCIYAYSGLKCEVAPWNELGSKYISVKMADGSELEADRLYTVACWAGTVADEYITETLQSYEGTWEELMTAKLLGDGTVVPANDSRITLIWD